MTEDQQRRGSLSILDSALIVAMFSAVCYVMGHAAQVGIAQRMGVPVFLMPHVGPESFVLIGATYLILLFAVGLFLYFVWFLVGKHTGLLKSKVGGIVSDMSSRAKQHPCTYLLLACLMAATIFCCGLLKSKVSVMSSRAKQHPRVYLLLACLMAAAIFYCVPLLLPFTPRSAGGQRAFGGPFESTVVTLRLKGSNADLAGRDLRYLWQDANIVVLQDKGSGELVLIKEDELSLLILTRLH